MATRMQQRRGTAAQWISTNSGNGPVLNSGEIGYESDTNKFKIGDGVNHWLSLPYFVDLNTTIAGAPGLLNSLDEIAAAIGDDPAFFTTVANNLALKAPLASPTFTGTVVLPINTITQPMMSDDSVGTNEILGQAVTNDKIANATITNAKISETAEIATYKISGLDTALSAKAPLASPTFTGTVSGVTKAHVGLGNVDNTADSAKPVSTAQAAAIATAKSEVKDEILGAGVPAALNTLDELAAALGDDANYAATITTALGLKASLVNLSDHNSATTNVHGIANTALLATQDYVNDQISNSESAYSSLAGNGLVWDAVDGEFDVDTTVIQQRVAGVTDTEIGYLDGVASAIQTQIDAKATPANITSAVSSHANTSLNIHGIADTSLLATMLYADTAVSNHSADTTNVHGISDFADLSTKSYTNNAVLDHSNDSTNIHGIVDTAELATKAFAAELLTQSTKTNITITGDKNGLTITAENGVADSTTDNLTEGSNNKYFTDERAQDAIGNNVGTGLSYNDATGAISVNTTAIQAKVANVDDTEIGYLDGVTSAIQTQIDTKAAIVSPTFSGTVSGITKTMVGLGSVDNTADTAKPVSTAQQAALDLKANLASPSLTGVPTAPTATAGTNTTQVATTAYVRGEVAALVNSAGSTLDTLGEIATALGNDANLSTTLTTAIGLKAPIASPTFTGTVTIPNGAVLGTPTSATLTNATGLPVATGIANLGTGVATFLTTPSSANLAAMITDEIGTGNIVLSEVATNSQTGSYTLVLADKGKMVEMNVGSANNLTVPLDSSVNFPVGSQIDILQVGSGQTTVVATGGVTVNGTPGLKIRSQWGGATLIKRAANTWVLIGDLTA
jgi:hypothetical protein